MEIFVTTYFIIEAVISSNLWDISVLSLHLMKYMYGMQDDKYFHKKNGMLEKLKCVELMTYD